MHKTKIEYGTDAWNPAIGCDNGPALCPVTQACWARGFAERGFGVYGQRPKGDRFAVRFLPERLNEPKRETRPGRILTCFMGDLFCPGRPAEEIQQVLDVVRECPRHSFLLLTKNPARYAEFDLPANAWAGTTVTSEEVVGRVFLLPATYRWVSYEPILGGFQDHSWMSQIDWLVMGAHDRGAEPPYRGWVEAALGYAGNHRVPIFIKDNLAPYMHRWGLPVYRQYPEGMVQP